MTLSESPENARRKSGVLFLYSCLKIAAQKSILYARMEQTSVKGLKFA